MSELSSVPFICNHFRFQWEKAQDCYVLLYPEGMVKLNGSAGEILAQCNGQRSVGQIIEVLQEKFPDSPGLADDTREFFEHALTQKWIDFV